MGVLRRLGLLLLLLTPLAAWAGEAEDAQAVTAAYRSGDPTEADARLAAFLQQYPQSPHRCALLLTAALATRSQSTAISRLRGVEQECAAEPQGAEALAALAHLQHLAGQESAAYLVCRDFGQRYPDAPQAPDILLLQGALEMRYRGGMQAGNAYASFLAKYPAHPLAVVALVGVADAKVKRGEWAEAHQAYLQALQTDPSRLDLPEVYFHLGMTAEEMGHKDAARHYYRELIKLFGDSDFAVRARDRLDTALATGSRPLSQPAANGEGNYSVSLGVYESMAEAEQAAQKYMAAGHKINYILQEDRCELLVGKFDSEPAARLFAQELAKKYNVSAVPKRIP